jgi:photosystem II stability/assembly factor-like uncharacterized protein
MREREHSCHPAMVVFCTAALLCLSMASAPNTYATGKIWISSGPDGVVSLAFNLQNTAIVYAGRHCGGVFKSTDGGSTWGNSGLTDHMITSLAINPENPAIVYAGTSSGHCTGGVDFAYGAIFKSTDGGSSWVEAYSLQYRSVNSVVLNPENPAIVYAGTGNGVFRSTDGGSTWGRASVWDNQYIYSLAVSP